MDTKNYKLTKRNAGWDRKVVYKVWDRENGYPCGMVFKWERFATPRGGRLVSWEAKRSSTDQFHSFPTLGEAATWLVEQRRLAAAAKANAKVA